MRIVRRLVHALVLVLTLVVGAAAAAVIVSQTAWFKNWLRGYIVREANQYLNGTLSIDRLGGNLFFGVEMENIGVSMDGSQVVAVKDLGLDYNVFELITKGLSIDNIRLNHPVIYLRREGETWDIARLVKRQATEADRSGPGRPISIDEIGVSDGSLVIDGPVGTSGVAVPRRFEHLDAKVAFKYEPVRYSINITHVSFRGSDPDLALNALSGGVSVRNDTVYIDKLALRTAESSMSVDGAVQQYLTKPVLNIQVSSDKLSIPEIARLVPSLKGVRLQPAFQVKLDGPLDRLGVQADVQSSAGALSAKLTTDVVAPGQSVVGTLSVKHVDLSAILNDPKQKSDITADTNFDLRSASFSDLNSLRGSLAVNAPHVAAAGYSADRVKADAKIDGRQVAINARAAAYGATATASGRVVLPMDATDVASGFSRTRFDLHGAARDVDLRKMPRNLNIPAAATNVNADYHVAGTPSDLTADARFERSTLAGAAIAPGSTVGVTIHGKDLAYRADATVNNLDLERVGAEFKVAALATDRYKSDINAHVIANGSGTKPAEMNVTASGRLTDTAIMGGRIPQLDFRAALANDNAHVTANGAFAGFDPAAASGKPALKGTVGGRLNVDGTVEHVSRGFTPDSVAGSAKIDLDPSTVAGLEIAKANVDADYRNSTADVRTFDIVGRDLNANVSGTLALNDSGQSNLKVHADSPSLAEIGKLVNQPITGIGKVDLTVTGNKRELRAQGSVTGDGVKYGENGALAVTSDVTATVPNLDASHATVSATTHGTFVTLGGQNINELTAKTDYSASELTFDFTAKQPKRSLASAGSLLLHPDHQEVHLRQLTLTSQGLTWQTPADAKPTIQYGHNAITVSDFRLVNADQQITADGTYGQPGKELKVVLANVDVGMVDALLLRPPQLSGRLNANATITTTGSGSSRTRQEPDVASGFSRTPQVNADFKIEMGGVNQFKYDSFGGSVKYSGDAVTLDTRLQQNPTTWLTAKGTAPVALFNGTGVTSNAPVDLHVDSSQVDLGLVQGFTTALTSVKGTFEAHVNVTGTASDPRPDGVVTIQNAAFKLEPTGVVYTDLDGRIDLQHDRIHIDQIRILDNQRKPLTVSGDLAVHERELGNVSINLAADDFKVIDNDLGNVRINSNLRLTGEINAPRLEGDLGINTGRLVLDPILNLIGTSAYATKPTEIGNNDAADTHGQKAPAPSAFEALVMSVHVTVPDDLVIKADDLRSPGAPLSLGALNVTLGGDLWATKEWGDQVRVTGLVNTVRGTYDFQGRRFTILRDGSVRFDGLDNLDPALDIRTERVIQAVTANVNVKGTLSMPEIELASTPPLEQADILSLIIFNQPINEVGEGAQISLAQRAQQLATGAVAGQLASSLGRALNLDTFEISTAPDNGATAQITAGQQIGQNLFVKVEESVGDQSQTNFVLEYELTKWLRLQTNVMQGSSTQQQLFKRMQGSGADLLFYVTF